MIGDEARVVTAFCRYLEADGWSTERESDSVDVVATRGSDRMIAEAKGRTTNPSVDVDTLYGQLLRRMTATGDQSIRYAAVVPAGLVNSALRVPAAVRARLAIEIFAVNDDDSVEAVAG